MNASIRSLPLAVPHCVSTMIVRGCTSNLNPAIFFFLSTDLSYLVISKRTGRNACPTVKHLGRPQYARIRPTNFSAADQTSYPKNHGGDDDMKCPVCSRHTGWVRTRCPACKSKLVQWYIIAAILILMACYGGLVILENVG